jgi:PAS domain S-box-containing protein
MSDAPWGGTSAPPGQAWEELIRSLREQPQVAEAIFEQLPTGLAIAEAPYGRLLYHNREAIRLIRHPMLPSESFGGYSQYGALHADGTPYRGDEYPIAQALSGRTIIDHEMLYRRGDGTLTTLSVNAAPIHDERGNIILAVSTFHDVSAQRQSAAALRESDARLKVALAGSGLATWTLDTDTWNGSWDRRLAILLGFAPDKLEVTRDEWQTVIHPDDRARVIEDMRAGIDGSGPFQSEFRVYRTDGVQVWFALQGGVIRRPDGRPFRAVGVVQDITERKETENALREALKRSTEILESINDAFFAIDAEMRFTYVNHRALQTWRRRSEDLIGFKLLDVFPQARGTEVEATYRTALEKRETLRLETISPVVHRWMAFSIYPAAGGGLSVYFRDITEQKDAEDRLKLLAAEVDHRSKNMLAMVQVLLRHTRGSTVSEYRRAAVGRIGALARAHTLLSSSRWQSADLTRLIEDELGPFLRGDSNRVRLEGPPVALTSGAAQSLALAIHELATNAAKYGALSVPGGQVAIDWRWIGVDGLLLSWKETGGPSVEKPTRRGFGSEVIEKSVREQLKGQVSSDWQADGLRCVLMLPSSQLMHTRG